VHGKLLKEFFGWVESPFARWLKIRVLDVFEQQLFNISSFKAAVEVVSLIYVDL
jgi:hypothetical protein